jgi:hypothetical protein
MDIMRHLSSQSKFDTGLLFQAALLLAFEAVDQARNYRIGHLQLPSSPQGIRDGYMISEALLYGRKKLGIAVDLESEEVRLFRAVGADIGNRNTSKNGSAMAAQSQQMQLDHNTLDQHLLVDLLAEVYEIVHYW